MECFSQSVMNVTNCDLSQSLLNIFIILKEETVNIPEMLIYSCFEVLQHDQLVPVYQQKMILERVLSIVCHCMVVAIVVNIPYIYLFWNHFTNFNPPSDNDHIYYIKWPHPFWNGDLNNGKITNISKRKFLSKTNVHIIDFCFRNFRVKRFLLKPTWARSSNEIFLIKISHIHFLLQNHVAIFDYI